MKMKEVIKNLLLWGKIFDLVQCTTPDPENMFGSSNYFRLVNRSYKTNYTVAHYDVDELYSEVFCL